MSPLVDRVAVVVARHSVITGLGYSRTRCGCGEVFSAPYVKSHAAHVAEQIAEALMSWDFLMALLNEHYPEDVFPTMEDRTDRDPGPRIVSLIRQIHQLREETP